ncbi:hypothetical protein DV738_g2943, partial [Chaetothyriales sp. CBS 135597]
MAALRATASYKKQNGLLVISKDRASLSWTPTSSSDSVPTLIISIANITNLQQTPESSAKVMLKVFAQSPGQSEPVAHIFTFTSPTDARGEANGIKDGLATLIAAHKQAQNAATVGTSGQSAAMTMANAISGKNSWEDDEKLKSDTDLQQSLLRADTSLQETFMKALQQKPSSLSITQFTSQFWTSRIYLLRAHAISRIQEKGKYNVFSSFGGSKKLDLTPDTIKAIFEQYPIVQRIYNEVTSPNSKRPENKKIRDVSQFWARFFQSRLYSSLRGMKVSDRDEVDHILDDYLSAPELTGLRPTFSEPHLAKFIDLEGNEENHSQRKGNRPDIDNRVSNLDKAPVIRRLNDISEKLMAAVKPMNNDVTAPIGMDEAEYEALRLRDLAGKPEERRIELRIQDQSGFFASGSASREGQYNPFAHMKPKEAIRSVIADVTKTFPQPGEGVIPTAAIEEINEDGYEDEEGEQVSGSISTTERILSLIQTHQSQTAPILPTSGLPERIYTQLIINHSTSLEFLRQFWSAFLSCDPARTSELSALVEALSSSIDRIYEIADEADKHRTAEIKKAEVWVMDMLKATGRRRKIDYSNMPAGGDRVKELCEPLFDGLNRALQQYKKEYEMQMGA